MKGIASLVAAAMIVAAPVAEAGWHEGRVTALKFAYDGTTVTFNISGYSRTNCTCYPSWSSDLCLDPSRTGTHKAELAFLMSARARGTTVHVNVDETTCFVVAMYETE